MPNTKSEDRLPSGSRSGRLKRLYKRLETEKRCGLIAYVTCGDPDWATTVAIVRALVHAGADAIELGIPFSDPIADGPVIQAASQRALANGTATQDVFKIAERIREGTDVPLIAFSYLNPIMRLGADRFAERASAAGIDSLLLTDLPPEAAKEMRTSLHERGLGLIFLLAPTSNPARIAAIDHASDDFIYYVSTTGVTGARKKLDPSLLTRLDEMRAQVKKPLAVGFGVSTHEHYQLLSDHCSAVVVGSAIVAAIADGPPAGAARRAADVVRSIMGKK